MRRAFLFFGFVGIPGQVILCPQQQYYGSSIITWRFFLRSLSECSCTVAGGVQEKSVADGCAVNLTGTHIQYQVQCTHTSCRVSRHVYPFRRDGHTFLLCPRGRNLRQVMRSRSLLGRRVYARYRRLWDLVLRGCFCGACLNCVRVVTSQ